MTAVSDETGRELEPTYLEAAKRVLIGAIAGSCTCNTKSPELFWHESNCRYVTLTYALESVENALSAAPVAQEPVAWRIRFKEGAVSRWFDGKPPKDIFDDGRTHEFAYAAPKDMHREFSFRFAAETVLNHFRKQEATGAHTRDRQFAIEILGKAFELNTSPPATPAGVGADEIARAANWKLVEGTMTTGEALIFDGSFIIAKVTRREDAELILALLSRGSGES